MESPRTELHVKVRSADTSVGSHSPSWVLQSRENAPKPRENVFLCPKFCHFLPLGWWDSGAELSALPELWRNSWSSVEFPEFQFGTPREGAEASPRVDSWLGDPQGTSKQIPEQFQAGAAPAPSVLVPSAGPCPCSIQLGKIGNCSS